MARPRIYNEPRVVTAVRLPRSLHAQLHQLAAEQSVSVNSLLSSAVDSYVKRNSSSAKSKKQPQP
jgi:predicted DNA-binding ribbon-helix-helix protein